MSQVNKQKLMNILGEIIGVADITYASTGSNSDTPSGQNNVTTITLGNASSGETYYSNAELWNAPGIISCPLLPEKSTNNTDSAQAIYYNFNDQKVIFGIRDTRNMNRAGNQDPGETTVYAPGSQACINLKKDGSITMSTTDDNTATGNNMVLQLSPAGFFLTMPFGTLTWDKTGLHICNDTGASIDMVSTANPACINAVMVTADNFTASSKVVNLGVGALLPAAVSIVPEALPGVPLTGLGAGLVLLEMVASPVVNIASLPTAVA